MVFFPNPIPVPQLSLVLPEIVLLALTCVVLLTDLFIPARSKIISYLLVQASLIAVAVILILQFHWPTTYTFSDMFVFDKIGSLMKIFMVGVVFFVFLYSRGYLRQTRLPQGEMYVLGMLSLLGMMVLVSANNFIPLYLGLELLSLPMTAMVAMNRGSGIAAEAAIKLFVMSALASAILLYGLSLLYGTTKSLDINQVAQAVATMPNSQYPVVILSLVFVVIGFAFKIGAVPFHMWVPDIYAGSPNSVVLFVSAAPKIAGLGMAIRLLVQALPSMNIEWQALLIVIAILSIALGNLVAIAQRSFKRMLAYSSIAHMGYMLLGLLAANPTGYGAALFYILVYSIMALGSFAVIVLMSNSGIEIENISDLQGLNSRDPWLAFLLMMLLFSMAGIPPLAGFFAKIGVLEALIGVHLVWLAAYALIFAIVGSYYYIRVVKVMYFEEPKITDPIQYSMEARLAMSVNGLAVLVLGIFPGVLFTLCQRAF